MMSGSHDFLLQRLHEHITRHVAQRLEHRHLVERLQAEGASLRDEALLLRRKLASILPTRSGRETYECSTSDEE